MGDQWDNVDGVKDRIEAGLYDSRHRKGPAGTVGVVVARFQVPELTIGHRSLLDHVAIKNERLLVLLGVSKIRDARNPLSFEMRRDMVEMYCRSYDLVVCPLMDCPDEDHAWSKSLDQVVRIIHPSASVTIYGGRNSFITHYTGLLPTSYFPEVIEPDGTTTRRIVSEHIVNSGDFRRGVIYAVTNYGIQSDTHDGQLQTDTLAPISGWSDDRL